LSMTLVGILKNVRRWDSERNKKDLFLLTKLCQVLLLGIASDDQRDAELPAGDGALFAK